MCLAVPCEVVELTGRTALVSVDGASREVDLSLVDGVRVGDYLLVHAGFAIECWSEQDVLEWKAMLDGTWSSDTWSGDAGLGESGSSESGSGEPL
jgi:hydrogenase expression/formation protein HypC